jgi:hypothetical protein
VIGCGVLLRRVTEAEAVNKAQADLLKTAQAWRRRMEMGGLPLSVASFEQVKREEAKEKEKEEKVVEPEESASPQETLHFLLEWEEQTVVDKHKSLVRLPPPISNNFPSATPLTER